MRSGEFEALLKALPDEQWQALVDGQMLALHEDARLELSRGGDEYTIVKAREEEDAEELRERVIGHAREILEDFYRTHPLSREAFDRQAGLLVSQYGEQAFAAPEGRLPERSFFVDGGELKAEPRESPRQRYGAWCETGKPQEGAALKERVNDWINKGEAYEAYRGMNVCRYNC